MSLSDAEFLEAMAAELGHPAGPQTEVEMIRRHGLAGRLHAIADLLRERDRHDLETGAACGQDTELASDPATRALEAAWGVIANVSEGDWSKQTDEWRGAAERFRDQHWHPWLDRRQARRQKAATIKARDPLGSLERLRNALDGMEQITWRQPLGSAERRQASSLTDILLGMLAIAEQVERSNQLAEELLT